MEKQVIELQLFLGLFYHYYMSMHTRARTCTRTHKIKYMKEPGNILNDRSFHFQKHLEIPSKHTRAYLYCLIDIVFPAPSSHL